MGMVVVMDGDLEREMGTRDPVGAKVKKWGWLCAWGSMQVENNGNGMKAGVMGGGNRWYVGWMMMGSEDGHGYVGRRRYWVQMEVKLCNGNAENETSRRHNKNRAPITRVKWTIRASFLISTNQLKYRRWAKTNFKGGFKKKNKTWMPVPHTKISKQSSENRLELKHSASASASELKTP